MANLTFNTGDGYTPPLGSIIPLHFAESPVLTIYQIGTDSATVGTPKIDTALKYVTCNGIDPPNAFGLPQVINLNRYLSAEGSNFAAIGQPVAQLFNRELLPAGIAATSYGTALIVNRNPVALLLGFDAAAFGTAWISTRTQGVLTAGADVSVFGTQWISNKTRTLITHGRDVSVWPNPFVSYKNRTLSINGFLATNPSFSNETTVTHFHRTLNLTGYDAARFGTTWLSHNIQEVAPTGFDAAKYGTTRAEYRNRSVTQNSTYSDFGSVSAFATIGLFSRVLEPVGIEVVSYIPFPRIKVPVLVAGFDASLFGLPSFLPAEQGTQPSGFNDASYGAIVVTQGPATTALRPQGFASAQFGTAAVLSLGQWVFCAGSVFERAGVPRAASGLNPTSFEAQLIGVPEASPSRQRVYTVGSNALLGRPTVGYGVRAVAPNSIQIDESTRHSIRLQMLDYGEVVRTTTNGLQIRHVQNSYHVHTGAQ